MPEGKCGFAGKYARAGGKATAKVDTLPIHPVRVGRWANHACLLHFLQRIVDLLATDINTAGVVTSERGRSLGAKFPSANFLARIIRRSNHAH